MSGRVAPGVVKALVRRLVSAAGGVEAAAIELGVSHQRVSYCQVVERPDQLNILQVARLEELVGRPIVTAALARMVEAGEVVPIDDAAVAGVRSAADLMAKIHAMESDGHRDPGEIRVIQAAAGELLREIQRVHDAAMRLTPGPVR